MKCFLSRLFCCVVIITFLTSPEKASAQEDTSKQQVALEASVHGGFTIPHSEEIRHLVQGHTVAFGLAIEWKTTGAKYWHQAYRYPSIGIDLYHANLGNSRQLGTGTNAIFYIQLPINTSERFRQYVRPGFGLGYVSKTYDLETNSKNFVISSRLNAAILLEYGCEIKVSDQFKIIPAIRLTHFSNGAYQKPNLGINIPTVSVGLQWIAKEGDFTKEQVPEPETDKWAFTSFVGFGVKENLPPGGDKYLAYTWSNMVEKRFSYKSSLALGVDFMYNNALLHLHSNGSEHTAPDIKFQTGAFLGYTMHLSNFRILMQAGTYLLDKFDENGFIYNRFGLRYNFNKHWEAGLHLKTHFIVADYFEAGMAFRF